MAELKPFLGIAAKDHERGLRLGKVLRRLADHSVVGTPLDPCQVLDVDKPPCLHHRHDLHRAHEE